MKTLISMLGAGMLFVGGFGVATLYAEGDGNRTADDSVQVQRLNGTTSKEHMDAMGETEMEQHGDMDEFHNGTDTMKMDDRIKEARENMTDRFKEIRDEAQKRIEEAKAKALDRREELKNRLDDARKDRIKAFLERLYKRFAAAIDRLEHISERVTARIDKIEEKTGIDLSEAKGLVETANMEIADAKAALEEARAEVAAAIESDTPKESMSAVEAFIREAHSHVKAAHQALVSAIRAIRADAPRAADTDSGAETDSDESSDN